MQSLKSNQTLGHIFIETDSSISFIRPPIDKRLIALAKVIHEGKKLFRVEVEIFCKQKLVAKSNLTFMIVQAFDPS